MYSAELSRLGLIVRLHVTIHKRHRLRVVVTLAGNALVGAVNERAPHCERPVTDGFLFRIHNVDALNRAFRRTPFHLVVAQEIPAFLAPPKRWFLNEKA